MSDIIADGVKIARSDTADGSTALHINLPPGFTTEEVARLRMAADAWFDDVMRHASPVENTDA